MRGEGALAPAVLTAKAGGDYVFLDMTRAGFDLSDRGVTGRNAPGAIDVLAWPERGIYRVGETVHAAAAKLGLMIPKACGMGICGTCKVLKLGGDVEMEHNGGITDEDVAEGYILSCCSVPKGDVRIEF